MQITCTQKEFVDFKIKKLREYHNLKDQSDTLLLADVFNNFWNMNLQKYGLDPAHFVCTRLSIASTLKRAKNIFRFINC